jgi:hypothetical protein
MICHEMSLEWHDIAIWANIDPFRDCLVELWMPFTYYIWGERVEATIVKDVVDDKRIKWLRGEAMDDEKCCKCTKRLQASATSIWNCP